MTKIKTECPDCGHEYEIELDKSISEVISQGIEKGKTNLSESEKDKIKEEAAKNTLSAQKLINKKEIEDLRAHFTKKFEDQEERHKDEKKDLEDKRNKFRERVGKIGSKIGNIGNQKSYDDGRLQEEDIEKFLIKKYKPLGDDIEPVPDGEEGADIIHTVNYKGNLIGKIVVESKNTQSFSKKYEEKLLNDMKNAKSNFGIFVTKTMPSVNRRESKKNVIKKYNNKMFIVKKDFSYSVLDFVSDSLRDNLILNFTNKSIATKDVNKEMKDLIDKINGPELSNIFIQFNLNLKNLVEAVVSDHKDRKKSYNKIKEIIINLVNNLKEQVNTFRSSPLITSKQLKEIEVQTDELHIL